MTEDKVKLHSYAVSFVCSLPTVMGKFDAKKADELGVPKGPLRCVYVCLIGYSLNPS